MEALVSDPIGPDSLAATRPFVLVLRLVISPGQRHVYGEVLDPETGRTRPFVGLSGLRRVVQDWMATEGRPIRGKSEG
jgi:hypothetical protein